MTHLLISTATAALGDSLVSFSHASGSIASLFHSPAAALAATTSYPMGQSYLPVLLMVLVALGFAAGTIVFSGLILPKFFRKLKPSNPNPIKMAPYECGIPVKDDARASVFVRFYLVALLFLLFDMETIYVVVWALIFRGSLTTPGAMVFLLAEMGMFLAILLVGYAYAWKKGALTWS